MDHDDTRAVEETEAARVERLGRQRPDKLTSIWRETGFVFSIVMSQVLSEYFVSGFTVLIPTVVRELDIPPAATTWPANAFSLTLAAFLLPFGRLADIYGGFYVYIAGCIWYCVWSLIAGFSQSELMLDFCRALQGLGPAAFLPASLTLLGSMYRPGPRKNMVFSIYGAMAAFGFFVGIFFAGVSAQYAGWRWYFWIGCLLCGCTAVVAYFAIPNDYAEHKGNGVKMDWWGSATTIIALILLVFAVTQSAHAPQGWATPYIYVTLILAVAAFAATIYVEGWVSEQPLLPFEVFKIKCMSPFIIGLLFAYGTLGIFLLYATLYMQNIFGISPMLTVAWYVPMALGGCILATVGGLLLHVVPPVILMAITGVAIIINSVLFATVPEHASYWAWIFPAMICATIAVDLIFTVANVFLTTSMPARQQGLAGALANVIPQFAIALWLGFADIVVTGTAGQGERQSYKNAFWFEMASGAAALVIFLGFVRIDRAKSDLTADEKEKQKGQEAVVPEQVAEKP
ncbi:hypothetical protein LTR78_008972 [Recurvomyces mirabilis]|uniref:Major facilitator superfamily (MFS) profile domain-containing protein n=1 Tax=Recurvomyces mirabilis TaxID=574656 RepID=A0AAE0TSK2_9PEZI|nr:hypothetical protein LTR78_008972 [Recurvomyces mirabilis]KAK5159773.1 hypothetical protein LTS14_001878 [Recurvomyces mirabilis]